MAVSAEPDPEAVRRLMEKYEREAAEEAAKPAPTVDYDHRSLESSSGMRDGSLFSGVSGGLSQGPVREDGAGAAGIGIGISANCGGTPKDAISPGTNATGRSLPR